jgi:hypothetical protein
MNIVSSTSNQAIDDCLAAYQACMSTAMRDASSEDGEHFSLMMSCAEACRVTAHFIVIGSSHHRHLCAECAEICENTAADCQRIGDMDECVEACRMAAESCRVLIH